MTKEELLACEIGTKLIHARLLVTVTGKREGDVEVEYPNGTKIWMWAHSMAAQLQPVGSEDQ